jgi:CDP-diacylglycerol pyrophosphatase
MFVRIRLLLAACLLLLAAPVARADPDALWKIVHRNCVPAAEAGKGSGICARVDPKAGWALLKDNSPGKPQQYLLIPTARVTGIEDPAVLAPDAPDWFADAWAARDLVAQRLGRPLDRSWMMLAINSPTARSQMQLHIHVGCVRPDVRAELAARAGMPPGTWSAPDFLDGEHPYRVMRILGRALAHPTPFQLLAELPTARADMGGYSLAVLGARFGTEPGFYLLATAANPERGNPAGAEELMAPACNIP